ncbi:hypothetical protein [Parendozoicomonas sp. Alg238-R29]|uniref:hypothetical protein n=1 Tax=Parendozoicomonas sp. Alg238-R29 TaxID=2993446 RepID=UPI00248D95DB|nr:hypothetical protein [Parendozoicomonas sp. Alg238-R29]
MSEQELRKYYKEKMSDGSVCTESEDEFVESCLSMAKDGYRVFLCPLAGRPTCIAIDRISIIEGARNEGRTVYEPVVTYA